MKQSEIAKAAIEQGVPKTTVDKDWVLGHLLHACYQSDELSDLLIFKGGTCLRKCWIEDYRFSEDLDFTLLDLQAPVTPTIIRKILQAAQTSSGALFHLDAFREQQWRNIPQGYLIEVKFWGADHHPNQPPLLHSRWLTTIHIDINYTEPLLNQAIPRPIMHPYSDHDRVFNLANSYSFPELVAEKIRALQQRNRPRDIYDVYTMASFLKEKDIPRINSLLAEKCRIKQLPFHDVSHFVNPEKQRINERHWNNALKHQISPQKLPGYHDAYQTVSEFIRNLLNCEKEQAV